MFLENTINNNSKNGWIEVICGSMFSGKTEELIRRVKRVQFANQKIKIFKPKIDNRYHKTDIVSHDKNKIPSIIVDNSTEIMGYCSDIEVVAIDEAQFFDDNIVDICNKLANSGKRVIVAGLDMDYLGKPFGAMPFIMATAEYVTKVHAICTKTGNLANYSHRKTSDDNLVSLGEKQEYEPLSRSEFWKIMKQ